MDCVCIVSNYLWLFAFPTIFEIQFVQFASVLTQPTVLAAVTTVDFVVQVVFVVVLECFLWLIFSFLFQSSNNFCCLSFDFVD